MDKTVKTRALPEDGKAAPKAGLTEVQEKTLELAKVNAQLGEAQKKNLEHLQTIAQLQESLKQEKAKAVEIANHSVQLERKLKSLSDLEAKANKAMMLEAKVKELSETLGKISGIASSGKSAS